MIELEEKLGKYIKNLSSDLKKNYLLSLMISLNDVLLFMDKLALREAFLDSLELSNKKVFIIATGFMEEIDKIRQEVFNKNVD